MGVCGPSPTIGMWSGSGRGTAPDATRAGLRASRRWVSISAFAVRRSGMRFIVMHKVTEEMETGAPPSPALIARMGVFLGELSMTGRFLAGESLKPSATRTRLGFAGGTRTVLPGPYARANELVAECLLIRVASHEEAI